MELTMKIRYLLLVLYEYKYNGKLYELGEILAKNGLKVTNAELEEIASTLSADNLLNTLSIGDTIYGQITVDGVEFLEENNFFSGKSYLPHDKIKPLERERMCTKLDELQARLQESAIGKLVPKEAITTEIEDLKSLLGILGKHSWMQILKGKLYEFGVGKVSQEEISRLIQSFDTQSASEGSLIPDFRI